MRKKLIYILIVMIIMTAAGTALIMVFGRAKTGSTKKVKVVSSFYPIYIILKNITDGVEDTEIFNLTENTSGCLHDYKLTTKDMRKLDSADLLIINGVGMESFIDDIEAVYPDLSIFCSTDNIELLPVHDEIHEDEEHSEIHGDEAYEHEAENHEHEEHTEHEHGEYNGHVWMDMDRYLQQITNIEEALCEIDSKNRAIYSKNAERYRDSIKELISECDTLFADIHNIKIIIFHDSFAYMADRLGMDVVYSIEIEGDEALSAGEVAEIIDVINNDQIKYLLVEEQYGDAIAKSIVSETDTEILCIDSLVTGEDTKDAYVNGMKENIKILSEILSR